MPASCYPREFHPQLYFPASPPPVGSCRHSALPGNVGRDWSFLFRWVGERVGHSAARPRDTAHPWRRDLVSFLCPLASPASPS